MDLSSLKTLILSVLAAAVVAGVAGYLIGDYRGKIALQDLQLQAAVLRAEQGAKAYTRLVAAQDALAASRADADALRVDAERVRQSYEHRLQRSSAAACRDERAAVAKCEGLLKRGADVAERCSLLLREHAAIHDATIEAVRP